MYLSQTLVTSPMYLHLDPAYSTFLLRTAFSSAAQAEGWWQNGRAAHQEFRPLLHPNRILSFNARRALLVGTWHRWGKCTPPAAAPSNADGLLSCATDHARGRTALPTHES